jgi:hypothetical protein
MSEKIKEIQSIEQEIEAALWSLELHDEIEKTYEAYLEAETKLEELAITTEDPAYAEKQRVLAYCLMRQGNLLRQKGRSGEAFALSEREMIAARASKDEIMLARSLMSNGTNRIIGGESAKGFELLEEACEIFASGASYDHQQGLGWYWILQADLANAGIIEREPVEVLEIAAQALAILEPIDNWPGVARVYAARAEVHKRLGNEKERVRDLEKQAYYKSKIETEENAG